MKSLKKISSALISVYHKDHLESIVRRLHELGVTLYATGGTQDFIEGLKLPVVAVENVTDYPSILGGRVKTLHPKIFGGILSRRENSSDITEMEEYRIPEIDLVVVDLYPFESTVASGSDEQSIIEKIDIGGISLIRAAAKNFKDVLIIPSVDQYSFLLNILEKQEGQTSLEDRKQMALQAFAVSSHYDTAIFNYFNADQSVNIFRQSILESRSLRYGENPHQQARFYGKLEDMFEQLHGKELSYNNLLDIDAAVSLMSEFSEPTVAILKHNNACGIASRNTISEAWTDALSGDPVSAFGGIIIANREIEKTSAEAMNQLFFEVLIAPSFTPEALEVLKQKKNRILLVQKSKTLPAKQFRTLLNGVVQQDRDILSETAKDMKTVTKIAPTAVEVSDLEFANKIVKHTKSNTIVLAKNKQLLASGTGQTSRVDALQQAIAKARHFGFELKGAVMSSDAFFPFPDCVEIADKAGIKTVIQPGGSIKDQESIDYCDQHGMSMVLTGVRHFKH
ncbi:MAG: bifunctional phosphoribosylaminoimidazolecarboxamide formyltransferase/IMP cyclohydrolase [Bacteroidetes bacterium]|nr:bifunctional phosphoribosylaminoimidazolecarboxamide formyltransferase/IMP cyclohydrolase [Bacteroidota bacterium]MBL0066699.1 bifunctional phosphoribosylaminoimidazolecarboxamide formyltransferase/IMP cyclohydrolase [Bacteroidota bacterium]MBL0138651.1 bifunctional phosphoribosylaminoimidazolecarboxamide formyltransferase/IMP cyclohydrolase [Bacteroidota bacterium]